MISFISGLLAMVLATFLFTKIRGFIKNRIKNNLGKKYTSLKNETSKIVKESYPAQVRALNSNLKSSIGNIYKKNGEEVFQWKKFRKMFNLGSGIEWVKSIKEIIDLRKLVIYTIILSGFFGYGYFKGKRNTPVKINLDYAKEFKMKIDGHYLVKPKNSQNIRIEDKQGNVIKNIKAKDFPLLAKKLKPIGFILEPIGVIGYGAGTLDKGVEGGVGVSFLKYWKWRLDTFLTNKGIYLGTSYQITDNSGVGLGVGKGYKADNRILVYYKWKF